MSTQPTQPLNSIPAVIASDATKTSFTERALANKAAFLAEEHVLGLIQDLRLLENSDIQQGVEIFTTFAKREKNEKLLELAAAVQERIDESWMYVPSAEVTASILEPYEKLINEMDSCLCLYRENELKGTLLGWQNNQNEGGSWIGLAQVAMHRIEEIAESLGLWITWFGTGDSCGNPEPANYWRNTQAASTTTH